jgi:hypothetical protein
MRVMVPSMARLIRFSVRSVRSIWLYTMRDRCPAIPRRRDGRHDCQRLLAPGTASRPRCATACHRQGCHREPDPGAGRGLRPARYLGQCRRDRDLPSGHHPAPQCPQRRHLRGRLPGLPVAREGTTAKDGRTLHLHEHEGQLRAVRADWPLTRDCARTT